MVHDASGRLDSLNPYYQILENSSRIFFSKISVFRGVTQTDSWKTRPGIWMSFPEIGLRHAPKILKLTIG